MDFVPDISQADFPKSIRKPWGLKYTVIFQKKAKKWFHKFQATRKIEDLNHAINIQQKLVSQILSGASQSILHRSQSWASLRVDLASMLWHRFNVINTADDLRIAIGLANSVVPSLENDSRRPEALFILAVAKFSYALFIRDVRALDGAITMIHMAIESAKNEELDASWVSRWVDMRYKRALFKIDLHELELAMMQAQELLDRLSADHPCGKVTLLHLEIMKAVRNDWMKDTGLTRSRIRIQDWKRDVHAAIYSTGLHSRRGFANAFDEQYLCQAEMDHCNAAIMQDSLIMNSTLSPDMSWSESSLRYARRLLLRFQRIDSAHDLSVACTTILSVLKNGLDGNIDEVQDELKGLTDSLPHHVLRMEALMASSVEGSKKKRLLFLQGRMLELGHHLDDFELQRQFNSLQRLDLEIEDLVNDISAKEVNNGAAIMARNRHIDNFHSLRRLDDECSLDEEEGIDGERIVHTTNQLAEVRLMLARRLWTRYQIGRDEDDLSAAILAAKETRSTDYFYRRDILLAEMLRHRYDMSGYREDLDDAINYEREAQSERPILSESTTIYSGEFESSQRKFDLAYNLFAKYRETGQLVDLETGLEECKEARSYLVSKQNLVSTPRICKWAYGLNFKYDLTQNTDFLEEAIAMVRRGIGIPQANKGDLLIALQTLGSLLFRRFMRLGKDNDLDEAISKLTLVASIPMKTSPERKQALTLLIGAREAKYKRTRERADFDSALLSIQELIEYEGMHSGVNTSAFSRLLDGHRLNLIFSETREAEALESAIKNLREGLSFLRVNAQDRNTYSLQLAELLLCRFESAGNVTNRDEALYRLIEVAESIHAAPLARLRALRVSMRLLLSKQDTDSLREASRLADLGRKLLPYICGRNLSAEDQQQAVMSVSGFAADGCSIFLQLGDENKALMHLEIGRGLILSNLIDNRRELHQVQKENPSLAAEYEKAHLAAFRPIDDDRPAFRERLLSQRREAFEQLENCSSRIRERTSERRFMMDPTMGELQEQAQEGPIFIVNVTDIRSDAIILMPTWVKSVALPELTTDLAPALIQQRLTDYNAMKHRSIGDGNGPVNHPLYLSWLWTKCVKLIFKTLEEAGFRSLERLPRVWWIGSGIAGTFPFHAAGCYADKSKPDENTLARCIPSYTATIKTLKFSRSRTFRLDVNEWLKPKLLLVAMPTTPGEDDLEGVDREIAIIQQAVKGFSECAEILPGPSAQVVLSNLRDFNIVHFACHAVADGSRPFDSHLLLQKRDTEGLKPDKLMISRISSLDMLGNAAIAFLSACSTARAKAPELADESIHIASIFQIAGFGHVIGSMWSANDIFSVEVVGCFYKFLVQGFIEAVHPAAGPARPRVRLDRVVGEALRHAVLEVRTAYINYPALWAPFIHFGA